VDTIEIKLENCMIENLTDLDKRLVLLNYMIKCSKEIREEKRIKMENGSFINREPVLGDTVQKNYNQNSKFSKRTGVVIKKICKQSVVLWEFTKTPTYEFDRNLRVLKMEDNPKPKEQYCVLVFGRVTAPVFFDTEEEAQQEAKRLLLKDQQTTYILKTISKMDLGDIKISSLE
jgi:hypothetical protein